MLGNVVPVNMVIRDKLHPQCIVEDAVGLNRSLIQSRKVIISCFCFGWRGFVFIILIKIIEKEAYYLFSILLNFQ